MSVIQFPGSRAKGNQQQKKKIDTSVPKAPAGYPAIGIDLGTTHSVVSIFNKDFEHPRTLDYSGNHLVPSMFYWDEGSQKEVVGIKARELYENKPESVVRSAKREMGRPEQIFHSNGRMYSSQEVARVIISFLMAHPEIQEIKEKHRGIWAVVTVPAHFNDAARQATFDAAAQAGVHVLRMINEPTSAALAYSMLPGSQDKDEESLAVFDLGGGTFDVSIVRREGFVFNVLSSEGDTHLGGDDFDEILVQRLVEALEDGLVKRRLKPDSPGYRKLLYHAEQAKKAFSTQGVYRVKDDDFDEVGTPLDVSLSRDDFEGDVQEIVQRTLELTEKAVHAAKLRTTQVSRILLVGGSTRVHCIQKMLDTYFESCEVDARLEPDLAVSWGAAIQAAIILGIQPDVILVDVCSYSLGIGVAEDSDTMSGNLSKLSKKYGIVGKLSDSELRKALGEKAEDFHKELLGMLRVAPIIHRNSALPARKSEFFSTIFDNQPAVQVVVAQGEAETVGDNKLIGTFLFPLKQPCAAGDRCEIQLTYDVNGMVHVMASQLGTDNVAEAHFDSQTGEVMGWNQLSEDLAKGRLGSTAQSKVTSRLQSVQEAVKPVNALILQAQRFHAGLANEDYRRHELENLVKNYAHFLEKAQSGEDNEDFLESLEDKILEIIDVQPE